MNIKKLEILKTDYEKHNEIALIMYILENSDQNKIRLIKSNDFQENVLLKLFSTTLMFFKNKHNSMLNTFGSKFEYKIEFN